MMVKDFIVPWVREAEPYSDKHMDVAWNSPKIIRMMSNENLIFPSKKVISAVVKAASLGNLYPGSGIKLREKIAKANGVKNDQVVLGNGSTDMINCVIQTFVAPGDEVIISIPTFGMYEARTRLMGGVPVKIPVDKNFYWDVGKIIKSVTKKTKLIFICSPNNPTGNQIKKEDLIKILDLGIPTFFDEAYFELEEKVVSRSPLLKKYPQMMVNRTFSKAYGLAGFRVGYLLCSTELASYLNRVRIPWNVSLISIAAALAGFGDTKNQELKRKNVIDGRNYIYAEINKMPGFKAFKSEGNFTLIDASVLGKDSLEIRDEMTKRGIFIRPMNGHQMESGFIRITIGNPIQNKLFIKTFKKYVKEIQK